MSSDSKKRGRAKGRAKKGLDAFHAAERAKADKVAEMQELAAAHSKCETCKGKPYQRRGFRGLEVWWCPEE